MAILEIIEGGEVGRTFRLGERNVTIGRAPTNLVQIVDSRISRRHCLVMRHEAGYKLTDLGSASGSFVNDERASDRVLALGDLIRLGGVTLLLRDDRGDQDGVLERRAIDPRVNARTMAGLPATKAATDAVANRPRLNTVDELGSSRDMQMFERLRTLLKAVRSVERPAEVFDQAAGVVMEFLAPDRCLVLKVGNQKLDILALRLNDGLDPERKRVRPRLNVLKPVIRDGGVVRTTLDPDAEEGIATVIAVPIVHREGHTIGLVYADSFADDRQPFIDDDLEILRNVARAIRPLV